MARHDGNTEIAESANASCLAADAVAADAVVVAAVVEAAGTSTLRMTEWMRRRLGYESWVEVLVQDKRSVG